MMAQIYLWSALLDGRAHGGPLTCGIDPRISEWPMPGTVFARALTRYLRVVTFQKRNIFSWQRSLHIRLPVLGLDMPLSHFDTDCLLTPICSATYSWLRWRSFLRFLIRFPRFVFIVNLLRRLYQQITTSVNILQSTLCQLLSAY